jgi:hypothetical protein
VSFGFTHDKKRLYFTEFFGGHRWITFMDLSGKYHSVLKLKMGKNYAVSRSIPLKDGGFLAGVAFHCEPRGKEDYFLYHCPAAIVKISAEGTLVSEILRTEHIHRISMIGTGGDLPVPFVPRFIWTRLPDGSIVFSEGLSNVLYVYDMKGKIIRHIQTPLPEPTPVTAKDLESWKQKYKNGIRDKGWLRRFGRVLDRYKKSIHKKKPNIGSITVTPGNHLLITAAWDPAVRKSRYWHIDLTGGMLKKMAINGSGLQVSRHFVFFRITDEDDNRLIYCLKRKGSEVDDLARAERLAATLSE